MLSTMLVRWSLRLLHKPLKTSRLRIADFGAADGGTSREMWDMVVGDLRANGDERQIEMLYTDLASNDFSTLFRYDAGHAR